MPVHTFTPRRATAVKPARRRLSANVICLFSEDRQPVANPRHRGRYPEGVVLLRRWPRIRPGVVCELYNGALSENHGKLVRAIEQDSDGDWVLLSMGEPIALSDATTRVPTGHYSLECFASPANLRRVWSPP